MFTFDVNSLQVCLISLLQQHMMHLVQTLWSVFVFFSSSDPHLSLFQLDCIVLNEINIVSCFFSKLYELCCIKNFKYLQSIFFKMHIDVLLSSHYMNQYNFELTWSGYILESLSLWFRLRTLDNFAKGVSFDKHVLYLLCRNV